MKKVAYIGSSHHLKRTGSALFLIELLQTVYHVDITIIDTWTDDFVPDDFVVDATYEAAVFFQTVPFQALPRVHCSNKVYFPMYDQCKGDKVDRWLLYRDFKIVCFSRTLYRKLDFLGLRCLSVQFFPEPSSITFDAPESSLFFWQRRPELGWDILKCLFPQGTLSTIHVHSVLDWGTATGPSDSERKDWNVTISDWFETREQYLDKIVENEMYLAPRLDEGIGFSFLEAMARNRVVVGYDSPTMNEYIVHGKTGYLFRGQRPGPIRLVDHRQMRAQIAEYMARGYHNWLTQKGGILRFIAEEHVGAPWRILLSEFRSFVLGILRKTKHSLMGREFP